MALDGHRIITGAEDKVVRIWNVSTGACLKDLEPHESPIRAVDSHDGVVAASDSKGEIIIWNTKMALEGREGKLAAFPHTQLQPLRPLLKLGEKVVVTAFSGKPTIQVTDFLR